MLGHNMIKLLVLFGVGSVCSVPCSVAYAQSPGLIVLHPLGQDFAAADAVAVAKVVHMTHPGVEAYTVNQVPVCQPVTLHLTVLTALKGSLSQGALVLHLPSVAITYYSGMSSNEDGSYILISLSHCADGSYQPYTTAFPFIPLGTSDPNVTQLEPADPITSCFEVLVSAAKDPSVRQLIVDSLWLDNNRSLPVGLAPYLHDPDPSVRAATLVCMASCQQVAALPLIRHFVAANPASDASSGVAWSVREYTTPLAVPSLCQLTFSPIAALRETAVYALYRIHEPSSVPVLILSLMDPDETAGTRTDAYAMLEQFSLYSVAPVNASPEQLSGSKSRCFAAFVAWWQHMLLNGQAASDEARTLSYIDHSPVVGDAIPTTLFSADAQIRLKTSATLIAQDNPDDIGYLMICLMDPNSQVSYSAYTYLRRYAVRDHVVASKLQGVPSEGAFASNYDTYTAPLYVWWHDYLSSKVPISNRQVQ
jgi:hypothetical protein